MKKLIGTLIVVFVVAPTLHAEPLDNYRKRMGWAFATSLIAEVLWPTPPPQTGRKVIVNLVGPRNASSSYEVKVRILPVRDQEEWDAVGTIPPYETSIPFSQLELPAQGRLKAYVFEEVSGGTFKGMNDIPFTSDSDDDIEIDVEVIP